MCIRDRVRIALPSSIQIDRLANELRLRNQVCYAEAAAQLGILDIAEAILEKIKSEVAQFEYLRKSRQLDRLNLIKGACERQRKEYDDAEESLLTGLSKVSEQSGLERIDSIVNTLTARRYAYQLAALYQKWGKRDEAKKYREMKFDFKPISTKSTQKSTQSTQKSTQSTQ